MVEYMMEIKDEKLEKILLKYAKSQGLKHVTIYIKGFPSFFKSTNIDDSKYYYIAIQQKTLDGTKLIEISPNQLKKILCNYYFPKDDYQVTRIIHESLMSCTMTRIIYITNYIIIYTPALLKEKNTENKKESISNKLNTDMMKKLNGFIDRLAVLPTQRKYPILKSIGELVTYMKNELSKISQNELFLEDDFSSGMAGLNLTVQTKASTIEQEIIFLETAYNNIIERRKDADMIIEKLKVAMETPTEENTELEKALVLKKTK